MAVAHIDRMDRMDRMDRIARIARPERAEPARPAYVRRYNPNIVRDPDDAHTLRDAHVVSRSGRRSRVPGRALLLGIVLGGGLLQHVLVSAPLEAAPMPLTIAPVAMAAAPAVAAVPATGRHVSTQTTPGVGARTGAGAGAGAGAAAGASGRPVPAAAAPAVMAPVPAHADAGSTAPGAAATTLLGATTGAATGARTSVLSIHLPPVGVVGDRARLALAPNGNGAIMHAPSVSVTAIRDALQAAGSPLLSATFADHKDAAEYIWDEGRVLGMDPAVLVGIFQHESGLGTQGMARLTNSVGNIRPVGNQPQLSGYRLYSSWQEGIDDCYRLLRSYVRGGATTVASAIPVWAPPSDNNDDSAYISSVLDTMGSLAADSGQ